MDNNNNNGGNGGGKTLTTLLVVGVLGTIGYLIYKAGKGAAATAAGGTTGVYPGTTVPVTHTAAGVKAPATATGATATGAAATIGVLAGLATSILGMFKKKPTTGATTSPVRTVTPSPTPKPTKTATTPTGNSPTTSGADVNYNDWDGNGGFIVINSDGSADYYYSDESYAGFGDPAGYWVTGGITGPNGGTIGRNNWDGANGFIEDFGNGTWDYYTTNGEYVGSGWYDNDGNWVTSMDI